MAVAERGYTMNEARLAGTHVKPMLSVEAQVEHLEARGVRFEECGKAEATRYLAEKNNYYKVASYRKLFPVRRGGAHDGEYANLDFAYLKDLSSIDQLLRYTLLTMTLDIEHFSKVKLLNMVGGSEGEDGYSVVSDYLASLSTARRRRIEGELDIMSRDPYCGEMVAKYRNDMPAWVFVESVSFGTFIGFYKFCADRWHNSVLKDEHYLLRQAKSGRNAAAHSSNIVNGFVGQDSRIGNYKPVSDALAAVGISKALRRRKMRNVAIQQIITTLYAYTRMVCGESSRCRASASLSALARRMDERASYYASNNTISSSFDFLKKVFDRWF